MAHFQIYVTWSVIHSGTNTESRIQEPEQKCQWEILWKFGEGVSDQCQTSLHWRWVQRWWCFWDMVPCLINRYLVFWGSCCVCLQIVKWMYQFHPNCWHIPVKLHDITQQKIIILHVNLISCRCLWCKCTLNQITSWIAAVLFSHVNFTFMCATDLEGVLGFEIGGCQVSSKY